MGNIKDNVLPQNTDSSRKGQQWNKQSLRTLPIMTETLHCRGCTTQCAEVSTHPILIHVSGSPLFLCPVTICKSIGTGPISLLQNLGRWPQRTIKSFSISIHRSTQGNLARTRLRLSSKEHHQLNHSPSDGIRFSLSLSLSLSCWWSLFQFKVFSLQVPEAIK